MAVSAASSAPAVKLRATPCCDSQRGGGEDRGLLPRDRRCWPVQCAMGATAANDTVDESVELIAGGQKHSFSRANTARSFPSFRKGIAEALPYTRKTFLKEAAPCSSRRVTVRTTSSQISAGVPSVLEGRTPRVTPAPKTFHAVGTRSRADGSGEGNDFGAGGIAAPRHQRGALSPD